MPPPRVTIKDIAEHVGVSKSLVSMHLNRHPLSRNIAADTKKRIDEAVRRFDYKPSMTARALRIGKSRTLGIVTGDIASAFSGCFAQLFLNEAVQRNYQMLISVTRYVPEEESRCLESLIGRQTDGILYTVSPDNIDPRHFDRLRHYPLLCLAPHPNFNSLTADLKDALDMAVLQLARRGHRAVTGLSGASRHNRGWHQAFHAACQAHGVEPVVVERAAVMNNPPAVLELMRDRGSTALVSYSSLYVMGLLRHCRQARVKDVPECVYRYGLPFDYLRHDAVVGIVSYPVKTLVEQAVEWLVEMVEAPGREPERREIPGAFMDRAAMEQYFQAQLADPAFAANSQRGPQDWDAERSAPENLDAAGTQGMIVG